MFGGFAASSLQLHAFGVTRLLLTLGLVLAVVVAVLIVAAIFAGVILLVRFLLRRADAASGGSSGS
ncbi:hypothetical protein FBY40_0238 [Microbacterium sp. SLBN-154]|uniref:hypothetical protein n=1 Tax=Microbacterium sp. SLBN-154 TaxID=2768458 RepID=UPI00116D2A45|nr:hypothetical protein [Microbacterium sp. SLBN-154]TQK17761.1 hypothetical protein FBY40_0238 [Microbacterium sp. SLBN-154]